MSTTIQDLELQMEDAKKLVDRRQAAIKLSMNPEFKKLCLDEYCVSEAARLVQQSSDPVLSDRERADALNMAQATGHFKRYMSMAIQMGYVAERDMPALEEALAEMRAEEDESAGVASVNGEEVEMEAMN